MNEKLILDTLSVIEKNIAAILARLPSKKLPLPYDYNPMGKKKCFSTKLLGGFRDPEIRTSIMRLRKDGMHFKDIEAYIKEHWPGQPEKWKSRSAIHRFVQAARNGRLREFGINSDL